MSKVRRTVKKGDLVMVMRGKSRGHRGKVLSFQEGRVTVEGAQMVRRHYRASSQRAESAIVDQEAPIHASNVMLMDPQTGAPTRISFRVVEGKKVRVSKKTGEKI